MFWEHNISNISKEPWSESSSEFCWGLYQRSQSWVLAKATPPDILRYFCLQIHRDQHAEIHLLFKNWSSVKWPLTSQLSETHVMRNSLMIIQIRNCCFSRLKLSQVHVLQSVIFSSQGHLLLEFRKCLYWPLHGTKTKNKKQHFYLVLFFWTTLISVTPFPPIEYPSGSSDSTNLNSVIQKQIHFILPLFCIFSTCMVAMVSLQILPFREWK